MGGVDGCEFENNGKMSISYAVSNKVDAAKK